MSLDFALRIEGAAAIAQPGTVLCELENRQTCFLAHDEWCFEQSLLEPGATWSVTQQVYFRNHKQRMMAFMLPYLVAQAFDERLNSFRRMLITYGKPGADLSSIIGAVNHLLHRHPGARARLETPPTGCNHAMVLGFWTDLLHADIELSAVDFLCYQPSFHYSIPGNWERIAD